MISPIQKEYALLAIWVMLYLIFSGFLLCLSGCAIKPVASSTDSNVDRAAIISDQIEDKSVIVQKWIQTH